MMSGEMDFELRILDCEFKRLLLQNIEKRRALTYFLGPGGTKR